MLLNLKHGQLQLPHPHGVLETMVIIMVKS